jgi:Fe-S cluster biosynthesis and repair protein YggX
MTDPALEQRIAQWQRMTSEDPANAMGWFSLGNACKDAERDTEAARALRKAIELDPSLSRAYQVLGQVLIRAGENDAAADVLTRGYTVAAERGDVMPQRAMESLLNKIDRPVPQVTAPKSAQPAVPTSGEQITDRRTGQVGSRLAEPPMRGPVGRFIADHYSAETWQEWIHMGTKVINELRLDFSRVDHQKLYDQHMMEWLGFTPEEVDQHAQRSGKSA